MISPILSHFQWGAHLELGDLLIRINDRASSLNQENMFEHLRQRDKMLIKMMESLQGHFDVKFELSPSQKVSLFYTNSVTNVAKQNTLVKLVKDAIFDPLQVNYGQLAERVKVLPMPFFLGLFIWLNARLSSTRNRKTLVVRIL